MQIYIFTVWTHHCGRFHNVYKKVFLLDFTVLEGQFFSVSRPFFFFLAFSSLLVVFVRFLDYEVVFWAKCYLFYRKHDGHAETGLSVGELGVPKGGGIPKGRGVLKGLLKAACFTSA